MEHRLSLQIAGIMSGSLCLLVHGLTQVKRSWAGPPLQVGTAFVLRVVIYTGKLTYYTTGDAGDEEKMKTVQIVERLVQPFVGTH